jgi:hypothetical protein
MKNITIKGACHEGWLVTRIAVYFMATVPLTGL